MSGERSEHTIQATALVHEAYVRLVDLRQVRWQERAQFFAIVAKGMRPILIEHARARGSSKRGGGVRPLNLNEGLMVSAKLNPEIVRLDEAPERLSRFYSRKAEVVEMRYCVKPLPRRNRANARLISRCKSKSCLASAGGPEPLFQ